MPPTTASTICASYPTIRDFVGEIVVVKYGGAAMESEETRHLVCQEVAALASIGIKIVVVHGGGKEISRMMERFGLIPHFIDGLRVTDAETMRITEMMLSGAINSDLTSRITRAGFPAVGLNGRAAQMLEAQRILSRSGESLGQTGEVVKTNVKPITALLDAGLLPVISPVGETGAGEAINLNADYAAAAIAGALKAKSCIFLTDVPGVKRNDDVQSSLREREIAAMINEGTISGGMVPKVECALRALKAGSPRAVICQASRHLIVSAALLGREGSGTEIVRD